VPRAGAVHELGTVALRDDRLSPAAVIEREKQALREALVAAQAQHCTVTEGG
tara:strand:- start:551 stop:706 length:156 start_codon:yes stop_codon:yes gene_type:complete